MYKNEFENLLKTNKIPQMVMFFGDCEFQIDYYIEKYRAKIGSDASLLKLYYSEFDLQMASDHISQIGLFSSTNLLIIRTDQKLPAKTLNELLSKLEKNSESFVIIRYEADDAREKSAWFKKNAPICNFVRFFKPNFSEAMMLLKEFATQKDIPINDSLLAALIRNYDSNLSLITKELEKFAIVSGESDKNLDELFLGYTENDNFRLTKMLIDKQSFIAELDRIFLENPEEMRIVSDQKRNFVQLFLFASSMRTKGSVDCMEILGYKPPKFVESEKIKLAQKIDKNSFLEIFRVLNDLEIAIKSSINIEKRSFLISELIKLQSKI